MTRSRRVNATIRRTAPGTQPGESRGGLVPQSTEQSPVRAYGMCKEMSRRHVRATSLQRVLAPLLNGLPIAAGNMASAVDNRQTSIEISWAFLHLHYVVWFLFETDAARSLHGGDTKLARDRGQSI